MLPRLICLAAFLCVGGIGFAQSTQAASGPDSITSEEIRAHVTYLASDELEGRLPGTPGNQKAAEYVMEHMKAAGLLPAGDARGYPHGFSAAGKVIHNLCGVLPGTSYRQQYVVIGAHYDHVGKGTFGSRGKRVGEIHNGADDNASGTAALLELMEAFAQTPCKRSLLFIAFNAEEMGLLGSKAWVERPTVSKTALQAMVNLDMIGRSTDRYVFVGGVHTGQGLRKILEDEAKPFNFNLELAGGGKGPSDFEPFYGAGVPVTFFFTGEHADYHLPEDDADRINSDTEADIVKLAYGAIRRLADGQRMKWQKDDRIAMPADSARAPDQAKVLFGLDLAARGSEKGGLLVERVRKGAAERAGIQKDDLILSIDGEPVPSRVAVNRILAARPLGSKATLEVKRDKRTRKLKLTLGEP